MAIKRIICMTAFCFSFFKLYSKIAANDVMIKKLIFYFMQNVLVLCNELTKQKKVVFYQSTWICWLVKVNSHLPSEKQQPIRTFLHAPPGGKPSWRETRRIWLDHSQVCQAGHTYVTTSAPACRLMPPPVSRDVSPMSQAQRRHWCLTLRRV